MQDCAFDVAVAGQQTDRGQRKIECEVPIGGRTGRDGPRTHRTKGTTVGQKDRRVDANGDDVKLAPTTVWILGSEGEGSVDGASLSSPSEKTEHTHAAGQYMFQ